MNKYRLKLEELPDWADIWCTSPLNISNYQYTKFKMVNRSGFSHLANQVLQAGPGNFLIGALKGLGQVGVQQGHADSEVRFIEVIGNVPAVLAVLSSLLYNSMEESQHVHQRCKGLVRTVSQYLIGYLVVRTAQVQFQTVGWFSDNL